jgi:diguanylate cyclase (GGDEF)-like protein/PAS domain S-box-containing protein
VLRQILIVLILSLQSLLVWADNALTQVSVQLPWKHQFEFAAFYVAKAQGYYQQVGLDVDIREGGLGIDTVDAVVSGKAGFVYDPQSSAIPTWIYFALTILLLGLFVSLVVMRKLKHYNTALAQEVAERKQIQTALMVSENNYRELVDNANVIILRMNFNGTISYFNEYAEHFFGYTRQEVLGKHVVGAIVPAMESESDRDLSEMVRLILSNTENHQLNENENMTKDGRRVWVQWTNRVIFDEHHQPVAVLSIGQDITERRKAEKKIHALAFYDSLTGLPNRRLILDRLHQALLQHQRTGGCGALLFIDLDNFKQLNDTQGHDVGDQLLIQIAQRLQSCVRIDDSVARLGGDEFVVVLDVLDDDMSIAVAEIESIVSTILLRLAEPYMLSNINSHISASIGITLFKDKHDSVNDLLKRADIAMYQAKAAGRNTFRFFDPKMQELAQWRSALEHDLRQSIARQEFFVHYQPQIDMNHKISGVEALVRWQHPVRGMVSPFDFIGLAEETGLIWDIGLQVLHQACAQLAQWQQAPASAHMTVSVNISARQFHRTDFVEMILAVVAEYGIDANFLLLEITESLLLNNVEEVVYKMNALKAEGIRFSIDDFGTGYSSLAYLKRLPLYELKIDRSFIMDIMRDESSSAIVTTFINLAHLLELHVVAEGVEDVAQHEFLVDNHCNLIQGFLFSRPVPAAEITRMLEG